jgi:hypothetical protein
VKLRSRRFGWCASLVIAEIACGIGAWVASDKSTGVLFMAVAILMASATISLYLRSRKRVRTGGEE